MARLSNSIILVLAIGSGFIAFLINLNLAKTKTPTPGTSFMVVGVTKDIEMGSIIRKDSLDLLSAPNNVNPKVLFTEFKTVEGKVTRRNLLKGEVIKTVDLLGEGESAASLIPSGYRAMVIPATIPSSISNLIQVGARVDVLLTYEKTRGEFDSVTLVNNAKVIGITEPESKGGMGGQPNKELSLTLAVSPEGAETLAYSMKKGTLNVVVRPPSDASDLADEKFFTLKELFSDKSAAPAVAQPESHGVEIIRGLRREKYQFTNFLSDDDENK